jgi:hypothetical protein
LILNRLFIRNIILSVLLIILLVIVLLYRSRTPYGKNQSSFASQPQKEITRIELSTDGNKLSLERNGNIWLVNGRQEARRSGIAFIESILTELKIKSPVSPDLFEEEISNKNIDPVKVRVFENNKLLKSFLVYKTGSNKYGNIMKIKERTKPFIVYVPGYEGDIGSGFTLNELFWLPYTVFNLLPSEISSITFENVADPATSFTIAGKNNIYTLSDENTSLAGWDSSRVRRYISYFTLIPFESWALDLSDTERNKIKSGSPICRITVKKTDGAQIFLTLWEKGNNETGAKDSDRLWGMTSAREDLFILRYFDIDPLLKKRSYFFTE